MAFSLYDASVANYLQILGGVSGVLDRSLAHFREHNVDPDTIVEARLAPDMLPSRNTLAAPSRECSRACSSRRRSRRHMILPGCSDWLPRPVEMLSA